MLLSIGQSRILHKQHNAQKGGKKGKQEACNLKKTEKLKGREV